MKKMEFGLSIFSVSADKFQFVEQFKLSNIGTPLSYDIEIIFREVLYEKANLD